MKGIIVRSELQLYALAKHLMRVEEFAFDTETSSLYVQAKGKVDLIGMSFCFGEYNTYYIPIGHVFDEDQLDLELVQHYLRPVFNRTDVRIIGHNIKFDCHVVTTFDMPIATTNLFCTQVAMWAIDENEPKSLKYMTNKVYGVDQTEMKTVLATVTNEEKKKVGLKGSNKPPFSLVRIDVGAPYAMADAYWTWRHYVDWVQDELVKEEMETIYYKVQMPFLRTLFNMERRGVRVDTQRLKKMQEEITTDMDDLAYKIYELAGVEFNVGSGQQVAELLFGYKKMDKKTGKFAGNKHLVDASFGFPVQGLTDGGAPSTSEDSLVSVSKLSYKKDKRKQEGIKLVKFLLRYKRLLKLKSSFIEGLLELIYPDGKVHPNFNQCGTDSGRLSCSEPNLQQLPRPIELPFEPERSRFNTDLEYEHAMDKYKKTKAEADFWKKYEIRDVFIPEDPNSQVIISVDFSNLEMVLLAHFSLDPLLMDTFIHRHDAHGSTAVNMFALDCEPDKAKKLYPALRQIAKTINFLNTKPRTA